jgi:hypothetical protein
MIFLDIDITFLEFDLHFKHDIKRIRNAMFYFREILIFLLCL